MEILKKPMHVLIEDIRARKLSAVEVVQAYIAQIQNKNQTINAVLATDFESALAKAEEIDEKIKNGQEVGSLAGIPIIIKDNISTKGLATTCASKMLEDYIPVYDATVIEKLKAADAIILGKANMDEFAMGSTNKTSYFGEVENPRVKKATPGGSSGGSAAAVASYMAPIALGSDTGGSVRQPAAFCGLYGLKPTYGAVSRYGLIAFASSLDQIGPLAHNAKDLALLMNVISGHDNKDSTSANVNYDDYAALLGRSLEGLKVGVPEEYLGEEILPEIKASLEKAKEILMKEGALVETCSMPNTKYAVPTYYFIATAEASSNLARYDGVRYGYRDSAENMIEMFKKTRSEGFGDEVKRRIMLGTYALSAGYYDAFYKKALQVRRLIQEDFNKVFERYDVLLTPTTVTTAFENGKIFTSAELYKQDICTVTSNLAGVPSLSLPFGVDGEDKPIGLQLIGPAFSEARLLQIADKIGQKEEK